MKGAGDMRTFLYNRSGNADISIWSLIRDQLINATATEYTEPIPVNHRNLSSLVAQIDGTAFDVKLYLEGYDGLVEKTGTEQLKPSSVGRVVLPEKYRGRIDSITTVEVVGGDGTDYYLGGSFDSETGVITLGTNLPDTSTVEVVFEYDDTVSSPAELQQYITAGKVDPLESDMMEVGQLTGVAPLFKSFSITPPALPFIRIAIEGQAGNGVDTVISLRMAGVAITRTM